MANWIGLSLPRWICVASTVKSIFIIVRQAQAKTAQKADRELPEHKNVYYCYRTECEFFYESKVPQIQTPLKISSIGSLCKEQDFFFKRKTVFFWHHFYKQIYNNSIIPSSNFTQEIARNTIINFILLGLMGDC